MRLERKHRFTDDEALSRLRALTDYWGARYGVQTDWTGSKARISGKVRGVSFDGTIDVSGGAMVADMKAGFLAEKLGAKGYVERKLDDYLDPAKPLESLRARAR
jgi:hypothetical protein